jgi:hypothetical protein
LNWEKPFKSLCAPNGTVTENCFDFSCIANALLPGLKQNFMQILF